jgi:hypothetical protein
VKSWVGVPALLLTACTAVAPLTTESPAPTSVESLAAQIRMDAQRSDHESDPKTRAELAAQASRDATVCLARDPQAVACLYGHALALGLDARAHPMRAGELLKNMLEALAGAEAADPDYDQAGPARVRALVLIRAPGWPLGPGDPEAGLVAARHAISLRPQYPPNLLALAEALAKTGDAQGARANYARARDAARALPPTADRDDWLRQADQALQLR